MRNRVSTGALAGALESGWLGERASMARAAASAGRNRASRRSRLYFRGGVGAIEQASPELARRPLAPAELPRQIEAATRLLRRLQALAPGNKDVQTVLVPPIAAADFNEIA